jgi:hypothetical protein
VETKICSKCKIEKTLLEFRKDKSKKDGFYPSCKKCFQLLREQRKEFYLLSSKNWYNLNREHSNKKSNEWIKNNPEKYKKILSNWESKNRKYRNTYSVERRKNNKLTQLSENSRTRIRCFLKKTNIRKTSSTFEMIGCTPQFLKEHLEKQFKDGMNWENYGLYGWHIDHIIPLSSAEDEDGVYKLCHYTNLQPLWAKENLSKGSKIINM